MTRIIAASDAEAFATKLLPPVSRGLLAMHLLNESLEKVARNYALGQPNGVVVGGPAIGADHLGVTGLSAFIQTQIEEPLEGTYFVVARATSTMAADATKPMLFGTFQSPAAAGGGNTFGVSMVLTSQEQVAAYAGRGTSVSNDTSAAPTLAVPNTRDWALYAMQTPDAGGSRLVNLTHNTESTFITPLPRFRSNGKFRIGSGYMTFGGSADMALWSAYDRILTDEELSIQANWIRDYLRGRYITV